MTDKKIFRPLGKCRTWTDVEKDLMNKLESKQDPLDDVIKQLKLRDVQKAIDAGCNVFAINKKTKKSLDK